MQDNYINNLNTEGQEDAVIGFLNEQGFEAQVHPDLCGLNRVVHAWRRK